MEKDILQDIPDSDLPLLRNLYKKYETDAPLIVSTLHTAIQWKKKNPKCNYLMFFGVNNDWLETGTFVCLMNYFILKIFFHTLEENCQTLYKAFSQTKRINWTSKLMLYSVLSRHAPIIYNIVNGFDLPKEEYIDGLWTISKEKALELQTKCPNNVYIGNLNKSHVTQVNEEWPHSYEGSEKYIGSFIEYNQSYGIFLISNDKLVSWVLRNNYGQPACLQTLPEYSGNGYATILAKLMSKKIAEEGYTPTVNIVRGNIASENLFGKLGYKDIEDCLFNYCI